MSSTPLSLPSSSSSQQHKKRKRSKIPPRTNRGVDFDRALDENDDVSDTELVAPPLGSRAIDEDYDEDEGDENEEDHEEGDEDDHRDDGRRAKGKSRATAKGGDKGKGSREDELGRKNKRIKGEQLMLRTLMDPDQARRFDAFSSVVIPKGPITRLNRELYDQKVQGNLPAMLAGMAKIFVTDVVELAKELQPHSEFPTGRLRPYHLRLAREELERRGVLGGARRNGGTGTALRSQKALFKR